ncbi:MAG: hypothetical protein KDA25_01655 [Phycisphaerales bacterium]|nr:hypothetical protein [Phycisphaerales bacterium]
MSQQIAPRVLVIRPASFAFHADAAHSNAFMHAPALDAAALRDRAAAEFDDFVGALADAGVDVLVVEDDPSLDLPDAVFPNNWISTHADGTVVLYPMATARRRAERRPAVLDAIRAGGGAIRTIVDLSGAEADGRFLEGTGSLVLDRANGVAFAARSPRTHPDLVRDWGARLGYDVVCFDAHDAAGVAVYHTNVMMAIGAGFVVVATSMIAAADRRRVLDALRAAGRTIVEITEDQVAAFAGNILHVRGHEGPVIALSARALDAFTPEQRTTLGAHGRLVAPPIPTIESCAGGGVRCMLAELFLPSAR